MTSHAGWPPNEHLVMDKGPAGRDNTLIGVPGKHNYLLGGYGDDTIYGGDAGDVIWGDYHPSGWPAHQTAVIHAGNGKNFIYANDTVNYVWTGTQPADGRARARGLRRDPLRKPRIVVYTSHHALPHYKLRRLPAHQLLLRRVLRGVRAAPRAHVRSPGRALFQQPRAAAPRRPAR